jgi:hypothetical protein
MLFDSTPIYHKTVAQSVRFSMKLFRRGSLERIFEVQIKKICDLNKTIHNK